MLYIQLAAGIVFSGILLFQKEQNVQEAPLILRQIAVVTVPTEKTSAELSETVLEETLPAVVETTTEEMKTDYVPSEEIVGGGKEEVVEIIVTYPLNLNTANTLELSTLPEIGTVLAERIVAYRETVGGFTACSELLQIDGIGEGIYEQILPFVFVEGETAIETIPTEPSVLDVNLATAEEFAQLPGVTPEIARNIVTLREQIHYFQNIHELLYANGMTDTLFLSIRDFLYVGDVQKEDEAVY